ncbi:MAG TPA: Ig-like domain-containing protein, partial [Terracidiphilus sp.]|nr:Ig-like domain-containing protein [Terracidiphilus sp.]
MAAFGLGATGAWSATCTVTSTADTNTTGTLRYCLNNLSTGTAMDTNAITFSVTGTITLSSALPVIANGVTITGPGANQLTINGGGLYSIFVVSSGNTVSISGLTIADGSGYTSGPVNGGGALFNTGTTTLQGCAMNGNSATLGGAIYNAGTLTVSNSTFSGNSAQAGGAITNGGGEPLTLTGSTFVNNSASANGGGAIENNGTLNAINNTFVGNSAPGSNGGAIANINGALGILTADNNIFAGSSSSGSGAAIYNFTTSTANAGNNVYYNNLVNGSEDDCFQCTSNSNPTSATSNPLALPLGNYGGTTQSYLPQPGSKAICAGSGSLAANLSTDQRGFAMNPSYNPCTTGSVDAGAVQTNYIQVQSSGDAGAGAADCQSTSCTLRDAVLLANANGYGDIDFASGVTSVTLSGSTLNLTEDTGINIIGPGASKLTINGGGSSSNFSVITVGSGVPAMLTGLTISNGNTTTNGGGIVNSGNLTASGLDITANTAGGGGGIYSGSALTVLDSTISGNAAAHGGGIDINAGTLELVESTVSGNTVTASGGAGLGGGIYGGGGTLTVVNSTITGNSISGNPKGDGGGIDVGSGSAVSLANSIVSGNTANGNGADTNGSFTDGGGNVIGGTVSLSGLGLNGPSAAVPTQIPLPGGANGNPAICAGKSSNLLSGITTDERGQPNTNTTYTGFSTSSPCVDAGAVQTNYSMSFTSNPPTPVTVDQGFGAAVTLDESGQPFSAGSVSIPVTLSSGTLTGTTTQSTSSGVATYSGLSAGTGTSLTLNASLSLNAALTSPLSLSAAGSSFDVNAAPTQVNLAASSSSVNVNQSVTFTATVSPNVTNLVAPGSVVAMTGSVAFSVGGQAITCGSGSAAFAYDATTGTAKQTCITSSLPGGNPDSITAVYTPGDNNYQTSPASAPVTVTVATITPTVTVTTSKSPSTVNDAVTFTATVTTSNQTVGFSSSDTVTFSAGESQLTCGAGSSGFNATTGVATCVINTLNASSSPQTITATFTPSSSDTSYATGSGTVQQTVNQASTSVTISTSASSPTTLGSSIAFSAQLTTPGTQTVPFAATGTVTFTDTTTSTVLCTASAASSTFTPSTGVATCTTSALSIGSNVISAVYNGDTNYSASSNANNTVTLQTIANPTHSLISSQNPVALNTNVTFTESVTGPSGVAQPTGTVAFTSNGGSISKACDSAAVNGSGVATCTTKFISSGNNTIVATYSGDKNYGGASDTMVQQVGTIGTTTTITAPTALNSTVNAPVAFAVSVVPVTTGGPSLAGTVTITDNGATICTGTIDSTTGTFSCTSQALTLNSNRVVASYSNDQNYTNSTSSPVTINVSQGSSSVSLSSSQTPSVVNTQVTFTANVTVPSGPAGTLSGGVTFTALNTSSNTTTTLCNNAPINVISGSSTGTATCPAALSAVAVYTITASYGGNTNFQGSNTTISQTVAQAATTTAFISPPTSSTVNQPVAFSVIVTGPPGTTSYTGTVTIADNGATVCSGLAVASNGAAQACPDSKMGAGAHTITASYVGDTTLGTSSSSITLGVSPASSSTVVTSSVNPSVVPNPNNVNDTVTFTATVMPNAGSVPLTGSVTFTNNGLTLP